MKLGWTCAGIYSFYQCKPGGCSIYSICESPYKDLKYQEIQKLIRVLIILIVQCSGRGVRDYTVYLDGHIDTDKLPAWYQELLEYNKMGIKEKGGK